MTFTLLLSLSCLGMQNVPSIYLFLFLRKKIVGRCFTKRLPSKLSLESSKVEKSTIMYMFFLFLLQKLRSFQRISEPRNNPKIIFKLYQKFITNAFRDTCGKKIVSKNPTLCRILIIGWGVRPPFNKTRRLEKSIRQALYLRFYLKTYKS
jgi:endonuclease III-like uncharacterized protein